MILNIGWASFTFHKNATFVSPKSHILDRNGVWYSSFWSEGPKNHLNLKHLVSEFVALDVDLEGQQYGTSRGSIGVSTDRAWGKKIEENNKSFMRWWFLGPSDQNDHTITIQNMRFVCVILLSLYSYFSYY